MKRVFLIGVTLILSIAILSSCKVEVVPEEQPVVEPLKYLKVTSADYIKYFKENAVTNDFGEKYILKTKGEVEDDSICFSDRLDLKLYFNRDFSMEEIKNLIVFDNKLKYNLSVLDNKLFLSFDKWQAGDEAQLKINEFSVKLKKVEQTKITAKLISPFPRENFDHLGIMCSDSYVPIGAELLIEFSNEVNDDLYVIDSILEHINVPCSIRFIDSRRMIIKFEDKLSNYNGGALVHFSFVDTLDHRGVSMDDDHGFIFSLIKRDDVAGIDLMNNSIINITDTQGIFDAVVSNDYILIKDFSSHIMNNGDIPDTTVYDNFITIYNRNKNTYKTLKEGKKTNAVQPQYFAESENSFFYGDTIYNYNGDVIYKFKDEIRNICYLADNKLAYTTIDKKDSVNTNVCKLVIFNIEDKLQEKAYEYTKYDFNNSEYIDFNRLSMIAINENEFIVDINNSIFSLNIKDGLLTKICEGSIFSRGASRKSLQKLLSPNKNKLIISQNYEPKIYDISNSKIIYSFNNNGILDNIVWLDNNTLFFNMKKRDEETYSIYKLVDFEHLVKTEHYGKPIQIIDNKLFVLR